jgi:hypothetical protein
LEFPRGALRLMNIVSIRYYILVNIVLKRYYIGMIKELKMNSRAIPELVFQMGRIASGEGLVERLTAAQWAVLRHDH